MPALRKVYAAAATAKKYDKIAITGELNFNGGGEFSGRLTAPLCVLGGICKQILEENFGVKTLAYLTRVGNASGEDYYDVCEKTNVADAFGYIGGVTSEKCRFDVFLIYKVDRFLWF